MKLFSFLLLLIISIEILSQQQNNTQKEPQSNNTNQQKKEEVKNNTQQKKEEPKNNTQQINNESKNNTKQNINPENNTKNEQSKNNTAKQEPKNTTTQNNQQANQTQLNQNNSKIQQNSTNLNTNGTINETEKMKTKEKLEKIFNLTESLIKFFQKNFGNNTENNTKASNVSAEDMEQIKRNQEEQGKRLIQERDRQRREYMESRAKAELIKLENKKKEEKRKKEQEERIKFERIMSNITFEESIQISLAKGETETLYLDLNSFVKLKMAIVLADEEEKVNFVLSGPNSYGRTTVLYKVYDKNYLFYEYETLRKGEYMIEITNRGKDDNELVVLLNEQKQKKKDNIDTEKIDKISMWLNNIDNNVNQLRNKKKMEIRQVNSHNDKVNKNNRSIVYYSIIEIFTMIIVFFAQSYYISSLVTKL